MEGFIAPPEPITGVNELYGDGSVRWKPAADFDIEGMGPPDSDVPMVLSSGPGNLPATYD